MLRKILNWFRNFSFSFEYSSKRGFRRMSDGAASQYFEDFVRDNTRRR
jgi:hypothetical protein